MAKRARGGVGTKPAQTKKLQPKNSRDPKPARQAAVVEAVVEAVVQAAPAKTKAAAKAPPQKRSRLDMKPAKPVRSRAAKASGATPAIEAAGRPVATLEKPKLALVPPPAPTIAAAQAPRAQDATGGDDPFRIQALDVERFSSNMARVIEEGGKALAAYLKPREVGQKGAEPIDGVAEVVKTIGHVAEYWLKDPARTMEAQGAIAQKYMALWDATLKGMSGEKVEPVAKPDPRDARFKDPQWSANPFFDFLKQFYLVSNELAETFVAKAELEPHLKHKASFYTKQVMNAVSPSNFVPTNPELLRETIGSNAENLVRGMNLLAKDIERGGGDLKISQSDETPFVFGKNIAVTPGKVVFENDLIQLIQYSPTTQTVGAIPLLIVPPWINKFYILDLTPEKSFVRWAVDQGLTVFIISWVNPDARHAHKGFDDYMAEGPIEAMRVIREITGQEDVHTIGYCVGGTLLAVTLGYLAAKGLKGPRTATFFTTQVDFTHAGDLLVFVDEKQIEALEHKMAGTGYLEGKSMATAFNMLRSNDLIWSYVVNNYMKGKQPMPFDLLYWNADSPRMPARNHSFYLRHCYLNNDLSNGRMEIAGEVIDLKKVTTPIYNLASREDHIAPARSVFLGSSAFGGPVEYVMAGSGHIAGVVNPPEKKKYQHWTGGPPKGSFDDWVARAEEHPGSWWPHWREWVRSHDGAEVSARVPGTKNRYPAIEDAPGRYVQVKG